MSTVNKITVTKNSSSNTYGLKDIDALRSAALTNVENEYVATKAYAVNDFLYRDDIFYKVIAPIPRGGTFVINQNIKATKLTDELAILNPTVIANPTGEVTGELEKLQVGNIVYGVSGGGSATLEGLEDTVIEEPTAAQPLTYDEENEVQINGGVIPIENGGTGNTTGYIKTGQKEGSTIGDNATIEGIDNVASGTAAHAEGQGTSAIGSKSHTEGANTKANNVEAHAEGTQTTAEGQGSHAEGGYTYAKGLYSHSEGNDTTAFGQYAHAEGRGSYGIADQSHAEGYFTSSQGYYSHSEGMNTSAVGSQSHAEGNQSTALGDQAHSEGYKTYAGKDYSHAEGSQTCAPGLSAHSENYYTKALGDYSHAEGNYTTAGGEASHAEGSYTYAAGYAHAEGSGKAYGSYSHAEGNYTNTASGATGAHAEGTATCAKGSYSHAEGAYTTTIGEASHTQGQNTTATGNRSSAAGSHTAAGYNDQFVIGYYNDNKSTSIFEVGNGTYEGTSNALELDASGNLVVSGSITDGDGNILGPGNTTVIANPSETATDNLLKLQVGNTVYGISGGSGEGVPAEVITENIETTTTSSQAYAIGDFLYKNNELYKAKTAIAQGDTFVVDTNIEETNITDEINTLKTNFQDGVDAVYDACVSKGSTPSSHALADVVDAIDNISGGTLGTKNITINGTYNAFSDNLDGYSSVTVNVSGGTTPIQINPFPQGASAITLYNENGITINTSSIDVSGTAAMNFTEAQAGYEGFVIELNVTPGKVYTVEFDYQNISVAYQENNYALGYLIETTPRTNYSAQTDQDNNIPRDNILHHHKNMVLATTSHIYMNFNVCAYADSQTNIAEITNLKVYEITSGTTDDILKYNFVTKDTTGRGATITINKYVNDALLLSTDYSYNSQTQPITIDNYFTLDYAVTTGYCWTYHLLKGSKSHNIGYTKSQGYGEIVDINEIFIDNTVLGSKTITQNGIYFPSNDNLDGYSKVIVDTISPGGGPINITSQVEEKTIDKRNISSLLEVNVSITSQVEEVTG